MNLLKLLKRTLSAFLIVLALGIMTALAANAQVLFENQSALKVLGINTLESYKKTDSVSAETLGNIIESVTGTKVVPATNSAEDVCDAYAEALGYKHLAGGNRSEDYLKISTEFSRVYSAHKNTVVTRSAMEEISAAVLDVCPMKKGGASLDPEYNTDKNTIAKERFGVIYEDGIVSGSYGDGVRRVESINKNQLLIENEIYYYDNPGTVTGRKLQYAYVDKAGKKEIAFIRNLPDIVVEEREGYNGREFFRRGVPFREGELKNERDLRLLDLNYNEVPIQTEIMQRHPDGSIMWLSVSFMWDVEGNGKYPFYFDFTKRGEYNSSVKAETSNLNSEITNGNVTAKLNKNGIYSLTHNGKDIAGKDGIRLSVRTADKPSYFVANKVTVVANGPVYAQLRISGTFFETNVGAEWFVTLYNGDDRLYHEMKFIAKGDQELYGQGLELSFLDDYVKKSFDKGANYSDNMASSTWYSLATEDGRSVVLASKDTTRFVGAVPGSGAINGFYSEEGTSSVDFCPIHRNSKYTWYDGVSRTVRLDMTFYAGGATDAEIGREADWAFTPPACTVASDRFVYAGWIDDNSQTDAFKRTEDLITSLYGRLWNTFEAGKFIHRMEVNYETRTVLTGDSDRSGGEVEYNLWRNYMVTGTPRLYDMLQESSEFWTDMMVYRGELDFLIGANRYQSKDYNSVSFRTTMPFYGDLSGLYFSYCITGDPYYKESFKMGADHWEKSTIEGDGFPNVSYWYAGSGFNEQTTYRRAAQFRFCAQVRGLYYAYELFGDEKYYNACKSIISFLETLQMDTGGFFESYNYYTREPNASEKNDDGTPAIADKIYIMEYGARMLIDFYNESGYEPTLDILKKLAKYLLDRTEDLGYGWDPNAEDIYMKRALSRGAGASVCIQSFLSEMYMATGDDYYLEALVRIYRMFAGSWNGGNTNRDMETGFSTFLKSSQTMSYIVNENKEKLAEWGYADVISLVQNDTVEDIYSYPEYKDEVVSKRNRRHSVNAFNTPNGRVVLLYNCELKTWGVDKEIAFNTTFSPSADTSLWFGHEQTVNKDGVTIYHPMRNVDIVSLMETKFKLLQFEGDIKATVTEYTPTAIEVKLTGNTDAVFSVADGFFSVKDYNSYKITVNGEERQISSIDGMIFDSVSLNGAETTVRIELV